MRTDEQIVTSRRRFLTNAASGIGAVALASMNTFTATSAFGHANTAVAPNDLEFIAMYAPP